MEPSFAIPSYLARRGETVQQELAEQARFAGSLVDDLTRAYPKGRAVAALSTIFESSVNLRRLLLEYRRECPKFSSDYVEFRGLLTQLTRSMSNS